MTHRLTKRIYWIAGCLFTTLMFGCSSDGVEPPPPVKFYINPSLETNNSRMVYLIVRGVKEKDFLDQTYNFIAGKAFPTTDDPTLLGVYPVYPGETQIVKLTTPAKDDMGIYLMFTQPGKSWKSFIERPFEDSYTIELPSDNTVTIGPEPGFFDRLFHY